MVTAIPDISIILPAHNEEQNVKAVYQEIRKYLPSKYTYEIMFVDDGSSDNTLIEIQKLAKKDPSHLKYLSFSRNFGHQIALKAGLDHAAGKCAITLDCDLQHPPHLIPDLLSWWEKGYEVVYTKRQDVDTPWLKNITATLFYQGMRLFSDVQLDNGVADYRLLDRKVLDQISQINESALFLRGMVKWLGFKQKAVLYTPNQRLYGESKYSFVKMLSFAFDGITAFSIKPLRVSMVIGFIISLLSAIYAMYAIVERLRGQSTITGWTSVIISVLFLGGIQLITLGILGEYIGKIFIEVKNRPLYIINEKNL